VLAAKAPAEGSGYAVIFYHILPNVIPPILVPALEIAVEFNRASLSFLASAFNT
jgi:ABC-type dipeptide/oligopeptide/nickel transport system permease subunit